MIPALLTMASRLDPQRVMRRLRMALVHYALAAFAFFFGLCFLLIAAFIAAADRFGALHAAIGFGVGFVLLGLLVLGVYGVRAGRERRQKKRDDRDAQMRTMATTIAVAAAPTLIRAIGLRTATILPVLGFIAYRIYQENSGTASTDELPPDERL